MMLKVLYGRNISSRYVKGKHCNQSAAKAPLDEDEEESWQSTPLQLHANKVVPNQSKIPRLNDDVEFSRSASSQAGIVLKRCRTNARNGSGLVEKGKEEEEAVEGDIFTKFVLKKRFIVSGNTMPVVAGSHYINKCFI